MRTADAICVYTCGWQLEMIDLIYFSPWPALDFDGAKIDGISWNSLDPFSHPFGGSIWRLRLDYVNYCIANGEIELEKSRAPELGAES